MKPARRRSFVVLGVLGTFPLAAEAQESRSVTTDVSSASCPTTARIRCDVLDGEPRTEELAAIAPLVRDLRDCLDALDLRTAAATATVSWSGAGAASVTIPHGASDGERACAALAKERFEKVANTTKLSLRCAYECDGARPAAPSTVPPSMPERESTPTTASTETRSSRTHWYGWQSLAADGVAAAVLSVGLATWTVESTVTGYAGFLFATPVIHAVHGNPGRAFGSFALRLFVPALAGGVGLGTAYATERDEITELSAVTASGIGVGIGAAACIAIDAVLLAHDKQTSQGERGHVERPTVMLRIGRTIGIAGAF